MKKLALVTIIISISMSLAGCSNSIATRNSNITIEEAKEIALKHANLTNNQVSFIRTETDMEDRVQKYDIEFYHENKEYDYEISAINGEIIECDYDVENYNIESKEDVNNTVENQLSNNTNKPSNNSTGNQQSNSGATLITIEEAKQIALSHAGLSSSQVSFVKHELDFDDGIQKYDIEFYFNNVEYNYEIDANTGNILQYERD